jgi:REP element-mobilizing transposase RayT
MDGEKNQHEVNMFACNLQRMNIMNDIIHLLMPADPALSSTLQRFPPSLLHRLRSSVVGF